MVNIRNLPAYVGLVLGISANEALGFNLVTRLGRRVMPRYRFTWPELGWFDNNALNEVLRRFGEQTGLNAHRRFALQQLVRLTAAIPGDTAECGVYLGCGSFIILQSHHRSPIPRIHHIFDSFQGLSTPSDKDGTYWSENDLSAGETIVQENLSEFGDRFKLYRGWIPQRFEEVADRTFSFVHIDVDLYQPTIDSVAFFYARLNPGAVLVCDDYGFTTCPGATAAVDEFLRGKPEGMIGLAGGGGFLIKGCATGAE